MQLPPIWQVTPFGVIAVVVAIAYEMGLRWLAHRQTPEHRRQSRRRSLAFYAGLLGLILVVSGPLERWAMAWLSVHMVAARPRDVLSPAAADHRCSVGPACCSRFRSTSASPPACWYYRRGWPRSAGCRCSRNPIVAVVLFNGVMVLWHMPVVFDWASWHGWVMNWLMAPSFVIVGLLFWRIILPSHPWPARGSTRMQVGAVVVTAFEMLVLAMAMSIFTKGPWYSMNIVMDGPAAALRDQRYAAGILWVCGDFWAIPALVLIVSASLGRDGGVSASLERVLGRRLSLRSAPASLGHRARPSPPPPVAARSGSTPGAAVVPALGAPAARRWRPGPRASPSLGTRAHPVVPVQEVPPHVDGESGEDRPFEHVHPAERGRRGRATARR